MGFYLRKAFRAGPIRFNLSKSGIGLSAGVTGARIGLSSRGQTYVHGGRGGIYYRKTLSGGSSRKSSDGGQRAYRQQVVPTKPIELTTDTGVTYGAPDEPEAPEKADGAQPTARPASRSGLLGLALAGAALSPALAGVIPWEMAVPGGVLLGLGPGVVGLRKKRAGDAYGRRLGAWLASSNPVRDEVRAEIDAARASRWLAPADARYFERQAYLTLIDEAMDAAGGDPDDLRRLARFEQTFALDPAFVRRTKLEAYRRAHVEATADHDLTGDEEAALEQAQTAFGLSDDDIAEELSLVNRLAELRAIRDGELPQVEARTPLRSGEVCHLRSEGRVLKKRILRSFTEDYQKYKVRGFVIDREGALFVTNRRILLVHEGTTSIPLDKIVDLEIDEDRRLLTLTRDGLVRPSYLTTPDALRAGAIIAALTDC